ncbi:nucleoid-associated protein [Olsenella urininfantis]|uniref:nucleoid-associated protein n=1 Tax=Olsenella urininfantis TaxID=1871033 RepID=UPI001F27C048|nr:nucleoid-associated protein [Olsenella urininfantis]
MLVCRRPSLSARTNACKPVIPMMHVSHAILHAFDFESGSAYPSERELDMGGRSVKSYVQRQLRKTISSAESKHGEFSEASVLREALESYAAGAGVGFVELSQQLARMLWEELRRCDELEQADLLVCDFTDTRDLKARAQDAGGQVADAMAAPAEDVDLEDLSVRYFAAILLPRKQAFVHELGADGAGAAANDILRQDSTLPNPTQKADTYLLVNMANGAIDFHDKRRTQGSQEVSVVADKLLRCVAQASSKEVVERVEQIVREVAEEAGENVTRAVAQAKHVVAQEAERAESFSPGEVGRRVFEERPELQERYERAAQESDLPEEVPVRRGVANRMAKSHKIKTDTGIEITFPSEYAADANYIEFTSDAEGYVSIVIKNVGRIENR